MRKLAGSPNDYKSYLKPMVHVFKKNGKIVRQYLCYRPAAKVKPGKADHKYDPEKCGWQYSLYFVYIGPVLCCIRCHRHLWSKEAYDKCPQCYRKLNAMAADHSPITSNPTDPGIITTHATASREYARA